MRDFSGNRVGACSLILLLGIATGACSGSSEAAQAAAATSVLVAATAVHRAATGDCWGRCSPGYVCNQEKGFCEPGECDPACPAGYSCVVTPTGTNCQSTPTPVFNPNPDPTITTQVSSPTARSDEKLPSRTPAAQPLAPARGPTGQVQIEKGNPGPYGGEPAPAGTPQQAPSPTTPGSEETSCKDSPKNAEKCKATPKESVPANSP